MLSRKYQTLSEFMFAPFGNHESQKEIDYRKKYREYSIKNSIRVKAMCIVENSYFLHLKVPSESQKSGKYEYDVVIRFFTDNPKVLLERNLRNYYIQFFSNSPGFMYQYAYVYKQKGFLIEALYNKLDADYVDKPPEKRNSGLDLSYDKTIYFACTYLLSTQFKYLEKHGVLSTKKVDSKKFFSNISDFKSIKIDQSLMAEEKKLNQLIKDKAPRSVLTTAKNNLLSNKILASTNTSLNKQGKTVTNIERITGKPKITGNKKKTATKSTRKK